MKASIVTGTAILLTLMGCATLPERHPLPLAQLKQYGLFSPRVEYGIKTNTIFKDIDVISEPKLVTKTTHIPCQLGNRFGVLFDVQGLPQDGTQKVLTVHWSHPLLVSPDGQSTASTEFRWPIRESEKDWQNLYFDWGLEETFEMVSGNWTITVHYEDIILVQQTFSVEGCSEGAQSKP